MDQNMGFRFPRLGFDSLWVYKNGGRYCDRHSCTLGSFDTEGTVPTVSPFDGSLSVFYEPIVGLAEVMVAKEAVVS